MNRSIEADAFVLHWNRPEECLRTVRLLQEQAVRLRITVVDNGSRPQCISVLKNELPDGVQLLEYPDNVGWGGAFNKAILAECCNSAAEFLFLVAHDALPEQDCLRLLLDCIQENPEAGIVCPQYPEPSVVTFSPMRSVRHVRHPAPEGRVASKVRVPHGTLCLLRRSCFLQIGGFDERFFAYGDEAEIGLRAWVHGWEVLQQWGAVVKNPGTWTESKLVFYLDARNSLLLASIYGGVGVVVLRTIFMLYSVARIYCSRSPSAIEIQARPKLGAIRDYYAGKLGHPARYIS